MSLIVDLLFQRVRDLRVDRRCRKRTMTKKHLDRLEIHPLLEPVRRNGVADRMRRHLCGQARLHEIMFERSIDGADSEALSPAVEKNRLRICFGFVHLAINGAFRMR